MVYANGKSVRKIRGRNCCMPCRFCLAWKALSTAKGTRSRASAVSFRWKKLVTFMEKASAEVTMAAVRQAMRRVSTRLAGSEMVCSIWD